MYPCTLPIWCLSCGNEYINSACLPCRHSNPTISLVYPIYYKTRNDQMKENDRSLQTSISFSSLYWLEQRPSHYDGELNGIAKALEGAREVRMLAILTDSKPAISAIKKLDKGFAPPRPKIEAHSTGRVPGNNFLTSITHVHHFGVRN